MEKQQLPRPAEMFALVRAELDTARTAVGDARDWAKSDWPPGTPGLTAAGSTARSKVLREVGALEAVLDKLRGAVDDAIKAEREVDRRIERAPGRAVEQEDGEGATTRS